MKKSIIQLYPFLKARRTDETEIKNHFGIKPTRYVKGANIAFPNRNVNPERSGDGS
jgi:hypothetical protein